MTEQEWQESTDPAAMLQALRVGDTTGVSLTINGHTFSVKTFTKHSVLTDRKLRLFATACCRQVWDGEVCACWMMDNDGSLRFESNCYNCHGTGRTGGLTDPRSRRAVEVAERYADGEATEEERAKADFEAAEPSGHSFHSPAWLAHATVGLSSASEVAWEMTRHPDLVPLAVQASLLRCIFGNPWRPAKLEPFTRVRVQDLASRIYEKRDWVGLPVLADAVEEAGCSSADMLAHLRGPGPHGRGCWPLDLILSKE